MKISVQFFSAFAALGFSISSPALAAGRIIHVKMGTGDGAGVPNPSAVVCKALGGTSLGVEYPEGQDAFCQLGWGLMPEWSLFGQVVEHKSVASQVFLAREYSPGTGPQTEWAAQLCAASAGQIVSSTETLRPNVHHQECRFSDGSAIEAWTLFMGRDFAPELADILANVTVILE